jgi:CO/xanthine dehydrogenase Mo-binding subunit
MLWGEILRSRYPHARIRGIDTSRAQALPEVKAVVTAQDLPTRRFGQMVIDEPLLATDKVRFMGEAVAVVAAVDQDTAKRALELIQVEYEELPPVLDPEAAMQEGSPLIHEDLASYPSSKVVKGSGNVCTHAVVCKGDVEAGFREADFVFEDFFRTQMIHQAYLEPHAALAEVDEGGRITVWTTTQAPFMVRSQLAGIFQVPMNRIRVIGTRCGGGFGGKSRSLVAPFCVLLALKTRRPVKIVLRMDEDFVSAHPRHPSVIYLRSGVKKDGTLVARQATVIFDTGAYSEYGPAATSTATLYALGPYRIPHVRADGYCVYTNKTSCGALRAPGAPQAVFAVESHMDMIAQRLGLDPLEFRRRNAVRDGDHSHTGQVYQNIGLHSCLEAVARHLEGQSPQEPNRAWGVACAQWGVGGTSSAAQVKINEDGTVTLLTGAIDIGNGSDTILCQIVAEELGLGLEDVSIVAGDTGSTPYDMATVGSRVTFSMGNAVRLAAADARQQLFQMAARILEARPEDLEARERRINVKGSPEKGVPIAELAQASHLRGGQVLGRGSFAAVAPSYDPQSAQGLMYPSKPGDTFCAQAAQVEVDPDTGRVRVLRVVSAHDVGCVVNPNGAEGQVDGGIAQGVGYALSEEVIFQNGKTANPLLLDYRVSTALDLPVIDYLLLEEPRGDGPFGAKGLGEPPHIPTAAAIANAIYNATGARIRELPITPEKLRTALREKSR